MVKIKENYKLRKIINEGKGQEDKNKINSTISENC